MLKPPICQIDYTSNRPRLSRRQRIARMLIIAATALSIAMAWHAAPALWGHLKAYYWLRQCLSYSAPSDQVVSDEETPTYYPMLSPLRWPPPISAVGPLKCWVELQPYVGWPVIRHQRAVLYLHSRQHVGGKPQLVVIEYERRMGTQLDFSCYTPRLGDPPDARSSPAGDGTFTIADINEESLKFFAGQTDSADNSHFTVPYEVGGKPGKIDGWLEPDGWINLSVRDGLLEVSTTRQRPFRHRYSGPVTAK